MRTHNPRRILLLALGGTIACKETPQGRKPRLTARELLRAIPRSPRIEVTPIDFLRLTIVYPKDFPRNGSRPLFIYSYGAYGHCWYKYDSTSYNRFCNIRSINSNKFFGYYVYPER